MKTPSGEWLEKTTKFGKLITNTMFPKDWSATKIQAEVDSAWARREPVVDKPDMWKGKSDSGVEITGFEKPRATAYPVYGGKK